MAAMTDGVPPLPRRAVELLRQWWVASHQEGAGDDTDQYAMRRATVAYRQLLNLVQGAPDDYGVKRGQLWLTSDGREVEVRRVCKDDRDASITTRGVVAKVYHGRISTISCRRLATFKLVRDAP